MTRKLQQMVRYLCPEHYLSERMSQKTFTEEQYHQGPVVLRGNHVAMCKVECERSDATAGHCETKH